MICHVGSIFCELCFMFPENDCSNKQKKGKKEKDIPKNKIYEVTVYLQNIVPLG